MLDEYQPIINAIVLAETNDLKVITNQEAKYLNTKITIIEEYANAGIEYLKSEVLDKGGSPVENLLAYLYKQKNDSKDEYIDLALLLELDTET